MTYTAPPVHNHWDCLHGAPCTGLPLTLADRELITGRTIADRDDDGTWCCTDCLQDLPSDPRARGAHVCGERPPRKGDAVWYCGPVPDGCGRLFTVGATRKPGRFRDGRVYVHDDFEFAGWVSAREVVVLRPARTEASR